MHRLNPILLLFGMVSSSLLSFGCDEGSGDASGGTGGASPQTSVVAQAASGTQSSPTTSTQVSANNSSASSSTGYDPGDPCPANAPCRFMPLGDSLTEGYEGGYRISLFRQVRAINKQIVFVGSKANGPALVDDAPFPREHEGHSGFYIDVTHGRGNISGLVDAAIANHQPHIIALMIGTNDVSRTHFPDSAERLALLLDQLAALAPDALIILAQIPPTQTDADNTYVEAYNAAMPALVAERVARGKKLMLVDMYSAFTSDPDYKTTLLYDNFHPGPPGDIVLAAVWFNAIKDLLH